MIYTALTKLLPYIEHHTRVKL